MNDQRFFDLAMKVIARQANDAERADLDALLAREPELRAEFTRLEADARVAKDALPLVECDAPHRRANFLSMRASGCKRRCGKRSVALNLQLKSRIVVWHGAGVGCLVWQRRQRWS